MTDVPNVNINIDLRDWSKPATLLIEKVSDAVGGIFLPGHIEKIAKALPSLNDDAKPKEIEKDWLVNFFDKAKMISDTEIQDLWSKILSGEANIPGSFSKRTINLMGSLDKKDALLFTKLCNFTVNFDQVLVPIIFETEDEIYKGNGISFSDLKHLDSINLISFEPLAGYTIKKTIQKLVISYHDRLIEITFPQYGENSLPVGKVL